MEEVKEDSLVKIDEKRKKKKKGEKEKRRQLSYLLLMKFNFAEKKKIKLGERGKTKKLSNLERKLSSFLNSISREKKHLLTFYYSQRNSDSDGSFFFRRYNLSPK